MNTILFYVDHTSRFNRNTGVQRCTRNLSRALIEKGIPLQPIKWDREKRCLQATSLDERRNLEKWEGPSARTWIDRDDKQEKTIRRARWLFIPEILSGPYNPSVFEIIDEAAKRQMKVALMFHDAIPIRCSDLYGGNSEITRREHHKYMLGLACSDLVVANSRTTAEHLRDFWKENKLKVKARLHYIPLADELIGTKRLTKYREKGKDKLLICVGSLEPRKNHMGLLKAMISLITKELWPENLKLAIVGWPNDQRVVSLINRAYEIGLPIIWESNADDRRMTELYGLSIASVYPSLEEGYGLPVAESIWHNRPCLCSGEGALGELSKKGGCLRVDTRNWYEIRDGLERLINDDSTRETLTMEIENRKPRKWSEVAAEWIDLIKIMQQESVKQR